MNITYLDSDPDLCAQQYFDRYLIRAILDIGQALSTALYSLRYVEPALYAPVHDQHPSVLWLSRSLTNLTWGVRLFEAMSLEYNFRFKKDHKTWLRLGQPMLHAVRSGRIAVNSNIRYLTTSMGGSYSWDKIPFFPPPQVVPNKYKVKRGLGAPVAPNAGSPPLIRVENGYKYQSLTTIMAYRRFYIHERPNEKWTRRNPPEWYITKNLNPLMMEMLDIEVRTPSRPEVMGRLSISNLGEPFYTRNKDDKSRRFFWGTRPERRWGNDTGTFNETQPIIEDTPRVVRGVADQADAFRFRTAVNWGITIANPLNMVMINTI